MRGKIFVNSSIATKPWRQFVAKSVLFIYLCLLICLVVPITVLWFVSLGHINLYLIWEGLFVPLGSKVFPEVD